MAEQGERVERVEVRVSGDAGLLPAPACDLDPGAPRQLLTALARARAHALRLEARRRNLRLDSVAVAARGVAGAGPDRLREVGLEVRILTAAPVHQVRELARAVEERAAGVPAASLEIVAVVPERPLRRAARSR